MATPTVRIPDEFQPGTSLRQLVDQASGWIRERYADLPFELSAEWAPREGGVALHLIEGDFSGAAELRLEELDSRPQFEHRLNRLFQKVNGEAIRAISKRLQLLTTGGDE